MTIRRIFVPGATYFFTVATERRQRVLTRPEFISALRDSVRSVRRSMPFGIVAWVVLPEHVHCIWQLPPDDADFSRRWSMIKRQVSQATAGLDLRRSRSRETRREFGLWQRRFWDHCIRDDRDLARHIDYIHWNPVKHGHVCQPRDWPYSTFHRYVTEGAVPWDWAGDDVAGEFGE